MGKKTGPKGKYKADKIDPVEVEKLAAMACTTEEIAHWFDVSNDTIERNFAAILKKGRSKGKMSMKRALFQKVQNGDLGAMVWWGKNFAGMSDKVETKVDDINVQQKAEVLSEVSHQILKALEKWNK